MVDERAARGVTTVLAQELPSKTHYCRKDNGKDRRNGGQRRRPKHLRNVFNGTKRHRKLKVEALDRILWRTSFRRNYGPFIRQTTGDDSKSLKKGDPWCIVLKRH
jgi:hypothetical protein